MAPRARKSKYEINRELVLSTAHIPRSDDHVFARIPKSSELQLTYWWVEPLMFGYRILLCDEICQEVILSERSAALLNLVRLGRKLKCKWLVLDPDGEIRGDLAQFDW